MSEQPVEYSTRWASPAAPTRRLPGDPGRLRGHCLCTCDGCCSGPFRSRGGDTGSGARDRDGGGVSRPAVT